MRIVAVHHTYYPSRKAHALQIAQMSAGIVARGVDFELWIPASGGPAALEAFDLQAAYGLPVAVSLRPVTVPFHVPPPQPSLLRKIVAVAKMRTNGWVFTVRAARRLRRLRHDVAGVYTRHIPFAYLLSLLPRRWAPMPVVLEVHELPSGAWKRRLWRGGMSRADYVVCISRGLVDELSSLVPGLERKAHVLPSGVSEAQIGYAGTDTGVARRMLGEEGETRTVIGFTGHLYRISGVDELVEAAARVDPDRFVFWIVGGREGDLSRIRRRIDEIGVRHVRLFGWVEPSRVVLYQRAADILAAPYRGDNTRVRYSSPLKIFEYLAAERPIVASDLPSLREVLDHGRNAFLVPYDEPEAWAAAFRRLQDEPETGARIAAAAGGDAKSYRWTERAKHILSLFDGPGEAADR